MVFRKEDQTSHRLYNAHEPTSGGLQSNEPKTGDGQTGDGQRVKLNQLINGKIIFLRFS